MKLFGYIPLQAKARQGRERTTGMLFTTTLKMHGTTVVLPERRGLTAVDAQPWATDEPIRVLLDRITADLNGESEAITDRSERYRLATLRLDAELATERARFEHLEKIARLESGNCDRSTTSYYVIHIPTGRDHYKGGSDLPLAEAIDAAMKKGK
jgi:hypothetical protein